MSDCDIPGKCPFCGEHTYCVNAHRPAQTRENIESTTIMRFRKMLDRLGIHGYYSEMMKEFETEGESAAPLPKWTEDQDTKFNDFCADLTDEQANLLDAYMKYRLAAATKPTAPNLCIVCGQVANHQYEDSWYCEPCYMADGSTRPTAPCPLVGKWRARKYSGKIGDADRVDAIHQCADELEAWEASKLND